VVSARGRVEVGIGPAAGGGGGFTLAVALDLEAPQIGRAEAVELMKRADESCPYSRATRGNIDVALSVSGTAFERATA
jgi:organic hydroperoxide reductase OsmC/OhrA